MTNVSPMLLRLDSVDSPIGRILLVHDEDGNLRALDFADCEARMRRLLRLHYGGVGLATAPAPKSIANALLGYFNGQLEALGAVRVETRGTAFQRRVWRALRDIPVGHTLSYRSLAALVGSPKAARAVGLANGANPVAIVVPCHRVIGANGALTGFGGGLHRKHWLLEHEGARSRACITRAAV